MKNKYYLKNNVVLEPLIDRWYAWPHLIQPITYAFNLKGRHIPIVESFIKNAELHRKAVLDPKMLGGPFMDFDERKMEWVVSHVDHLKENNKDLLELADMFLELNKILLEQAVGGSIDSIYKQMPEEVKGFVELFYDINNNPSYRIFENLIYKSKYYKTESQGFKFYEIKEDDRPFVLSTPRLDKNDFYLNIPFHSEKVDYLYSSTFEGRTIEELAENLEIPGDKIERFKTFFTNEKSDFSEYSGDNIRMRYFGHACVLLETKDISVLVDPVISYDYESSLTRYTYKDLPKEIDYVLISHNHQDHVLFETMLKIRHRIKKIIIPKSNGYLQDPSLKLILKNMGFNNIIEIDDFDEINLDKLKITGIPFLGEHSDLNIRCKTCYLLEINSSKIMFAADTKNISPEIYNKISEIYGTIDVLYLGMECDGAPLSWLYGVLLPTKINRENNYSRRLSGSNYDEAVSLVHAFKPKHVYVYAMGQEPWLNYIMSIKYTDESNPIIASNKLLDYCENNKIIAERLYREKELIL